VTAGLREVADASVGSRVEIVFDGMPRSGGPDGNGIMFVVSVFLQTERGFSAIRRHLRRRDGGIPISSLSARSD
jgi:hypothetical protein